jgi:hypothetical protein
MIDGERLKTEVKGILGEIKKEDFYKFLERGIHVTTYVGVRTGWHGFRIMKSTGTDHLYECDARYQVCRDAEAVGLAVLRAIKTADDKGLLVKLVQQS